MLEKEIDLNSFSYRKNTLEQLCVPALILYIISLYIFVDNLQLINISRLLFLIFAGITCLIILSRKKLLIENAMIYLYGFFVFCMASCFWSLNYDDSVRIVVMLVQMLILLFLICQALLSIQQIEMVVLGIAIAGVLLFIYGIWVYGLEDIYNAILTGKRLGKEISQENAMGRLASLAVIVLFCYGFERKNYFYFILMLMPFLMVLASGSRTAFAILVFGIFITIIAKIGFEKTHKLFIIMFAVATSLYFIWQLSIFNAIKLRYLSLYSAVTIGEGSGDMRINMMKWGMEWFGQSPVWGYGIGNYGELLAVKIGWNTYAHNNFIELLVGVGLIGFSLYYAVYVYIFYNLFQKMKKKEPMANTLFVLLFTWMCTEIGAVNYSDKMTYVLIGICISYIRLVAKNE